MEINLTPVWVTVFIFLVVMIFMLKNHSTEKEEKNLHWVEAFEQKEAKLQSEERDLNSERKSLKKELELKKQRVSDLEDKLYQQEEERSELKEDLENYHEEVIELEEILKKSAMFPTKELKRLQLNLVNVRSRVKETEALIMNKDKLVDDYKLSIADRKSEIEKLSIKLNSKKAEVKQLEQELIDKKDEIQNIQLAAERVNNDYLQEKKGLISKFSDAVGTNEDEQSTIWNKKASKKASEKVETIIQELNSSRTANLDSKNLWDNTPYFSFNN